jgi:glycosyltransferase involved in cell wall biosynthesis
MLCPMISSSSFITTYAYAKILGKKHDVKIAGPLLGDRPYIEDSALRFEFTDPPLRKPQQLAMLLSFFTNFIRLLKNDYDVVQVYKLLPHTAPAAALAKVFTRKPLVLTLDDYEARSPTKNPLKKLVLRLAELARGAANAVTVSSHLLQRAYGGDIVYQVCNEELFDPATHEGRAARKKLGVEGKVVIMHAGTFYDIKGLDILIEAVQSMGRDDVRLVLVGDGPERARLQALAGPETVFTGKVPLQEVPDYVAACDVYAIPTRKTPYTEAEIPGKIFEPMAMGRAIAASRVSDIPVILDEGRAGTLVEPDSAEALKKALERLVTDKAQREKLGKAARQRYLDYYSYAVVSKKIDEVFSRFRK